LILGFILVGPEFGIKTVYTAIMVPVSMGLFEKAFPDFTSLTDDPLLDVIGYIMVVGVGSAILFFRNASSGGLDIVAKIMNKHLKMDLGKAMSTAGIAVALTSVFVSDSKTVVLSVIGTYFCGMMLDYLMDGRRCDLAVIMQRDVAYLPFVFRKIVQSKTNTFRKYYDGISETINTQLGVVVDKYIESSKL
jgi:uncharacterized membrane-anchored protein YitT (DUF2179 family)